MKEQEEGLEGALSECFYGAVEGTEYEFGKKGYRAIKDCPMEREFEKEQKK